MYNIYNVGETSWTVWKWNMDYDRDRYEKTAHVGEENVEEDIWTSGRARNIENKNWSEIARPVSKFINNSRH